MVIDLGERYKNAFGFFPTKQSTKLRQLNFGNDVNVGNVYINNNSSFEDLTLKGDGLVLNFGYVPLSKNSDYSKIFAPPPICSFSIGKKLTETALNDTDSVVVERYATEPWDISIKGLVIDMDTHNYPSSKVRQLRQLFQVNNIFEVVSEMFLDLDISSIYITKFSIEGVQGFQDTMSFTMEARSIRPIEYSLLNNKKSV